MSIKPRYFLRFFVFSKKQIKFDAKRTKSSYTRSFSNGRTSDYNEALLGTPEWDFISQRIK